MKNSDLFFKNNNFQNETIGEKRLRSSIALPHKRARTVSKQALLRLQNFNFPLVSTATGSPVDLLTLEPDRPCTLGRANGSCEFTFDSRFVSKQHCQILFDSAERKIYIVDGTLLLCDGCCVVDEFRRRRRRRLLCGDKMLEEEEEVEGFSRVRVSLNGVFVNGVRVEKGMVRELNAGDEVLLVCGNQGGCRFRIRIGFVILGIVFKEEVLRGLNESELEKLQLLRKRTTSGHSQGSVSSGKRNKRVFALHSSDVGNLECDFSQLKCADPAQRANFLISQCRNILNSDDPVSCIQRCAIPGSGVEGIYGCSTRHTCLNFSNISTCSIDGGLAEKIAEPVSGKGQVSCDKKASMVRSRSASFAYEEVVLEEYHDIVNCGASADHLCHKDHSGVPNETVIGSNNSKVLSVSSEGREDALCCDTKDKSQSWAANLCSPPGKKFYLNRLEFMDHTSTNENVISLPELLYPVESISQLFIATFTSDILWFLSYCGIPCHLPLTIACHNTERCWSSSPNKRTSVPYPDFPNLVVVFPPFPEAIAFGQNRKKQGIACHHPKLFVLQREDSIRVIITSANLVEKQWSSVTNTVWWQDFPLRSSPDYLSLFIQPPLEEVNQDTRSDFAAQLASFMASLLIDVPSQSHWIVDLANYNFDGATGHLIASVPGIYSYGNPSLSEFICSKPVNHFAPWSFGVDFLGSVEASVVGLSYLFRTAADSSGVQIKKLASFLGKSCANAYGMLEIVLRRNTNVPADVNAVSVLVPNSYESSEGDCVQLGFLPRNIAKWVSPLWDIGFFRFSGFVSRENVLAAALGGLNKKVQLILHVSQGPHFSDISKMMQPQHVFALSSLIASIQRCRGLWRLQEILGQYRWPELQESDFIFGSSSIGSSINAQFLAEFAAAAGKKSLRFFDSEESDPEWGCWSASQELKRPSVRILFPTIERVKNACGGVLPSKQILCFSEKTWQRLKTVDIIHDAIPHPYDRVGHPMHVKVACRRFQSRTDASSFGWVYCGSHNFSAAAWGRTISSPSGLKSNGRKEKANSFSSLRLHICNYELGVIFVFPPSETRGRSEKNSTNMDDVVMPFVLPAPKYRPTDRPATAKAMRAVLAELTIEQRPKLVEQEAAEETMEEVPDEEEEEEATEYIAEEKEEEKAYAEVLWTQVDSSESC